MSTGKLARPRILYIDNLRIFLTALVVLHHFAITYGAPGGWFYNESQAEFPEIIPMAMFVATNQAFFMGMFFFIAAYFITPSLRKKGVQKFTKDRLVRLGIPTVLFFFLLFPLTVFIINNYIQGEDISLWNYIFQENIFGFGPMWFVEALLIFTFVYLMVNGRDEKKQKTRRIPFPGAGKIILFALLIGLGQFIIRIWLPVGWAMPFTNFQFPHFLQYIFLFAFGIVAYQQKWLDNITEKMGRQWFLFVQLLIFIGFPALFIFGGAADNGTGEFMGGLNWKSFSYALWEQLVGIGMIIALFGLFRSRLNHQGTMAKKLSASAYGVYVFHPPLISVVSVLFLNLNLPQIWKFIVLAPVALAVCFAVAYINKKIPIAKTIF